MTTHLANTNDHNIDKTICEKLDKQIDKTNDKKTQ